MHPIALTKETAPPTSVTHCREPKYSGKKTKGLNGLLPMPVGKATCSNAGRAPGALVRPSLNNQYILLDLNMWR